MAVISNVTLTIEKSTTMPKYVRVTIKYRLTPSRVEQMAGSVFSDEFSLMSRDWLIVPMDAPVSAESGLTVPTRDNPIITIAGGPFPVSGSASHVDRSRVFTISKSKLNEDPELSASGSEVQDEVLARVKVAYVANQPVGTVAPPPAFSSVLTGTWV